MKYYRSQMISFDRGTILYWSEDDKGNAKDIIKKDIPIGAEINDVTYPKHPKIIINTRLVN